MQNKLEVNVKGFVAYYPVKANYKLTILGIGVHIDPRHTEYIKVLLFGDDAKNAMDYQKGMAVQFKGELDLKTKRQKDGKGLKAELVVRTFKMEQCGRTEPHYLRAIAVTGNLEGDPRPSQTRNGTEVSNFEVVVDRSYKGKYSKTRVAVSTFGKIGNACNIHLYRGRQVSGEGDIRLKHWTDRNGMPQANLTVIASNVKFLAHTRAKKAAMAAAEREAA